MWGGGCRIWCTDSTLIACAYVVHVEGPSQLTFTADTAAAKWWGVSFTHDCSQTARDLFIWPALLHPISEKAPQEKADFNLIRTLAKAKLTSLALRISGTSRCRVYFTSWERWEDGIRQRDLTRPFSALPNSRSPMCLKTPATTTTLALTRLIKCSKKMVPLIYLTKSAAARRAFHPVSSAQVICRREGWYNKSVTFEKKYGSLLIQFRLLVNYYFTLLYLTL